MQGFGDGMVSFGVLMVLVLGLRFRLGAEEFGLNPQCQGMVSFNGFRLGLGGSLGTWAGHGFRRV